MNRRTFTKVAGVSMSGVLAGCTSPDEEPEDGTDADDTVPTEDDEDPTDDPDGGDEDVDDDSAEDDDADETDDESDADTDDTVDDSENEADEDGDIDSGDDNSADDEETDDQTTDADDDADNGDEDPEDDEEGDNQAADSDDDAEAEDDAPEEPDGLNAELEFDDELEDLLAVDHEFVWESGEGSHLCNINVEMENTTSDSELFYEGIGMIVDADGNHLSSDVARFSLGSETSTEHTFSLDQCAEAATYRVEFNADQIVEE